MLGAKGRETRHPIKGGRQPSEPVKNMPPRAQTRPPNGVENGPRLSPPPPPFTAMVFVCLSSNFNFNLGTTPPRRAREKNIPAGDGGSPSKISQNLYSEKALCERSH